jgi:hypothetical protein
VSKIPEMQRQQLASPAVGTPGIDTSGSSFWNTVADVTEKMFYVTLGKQKEKEAAKDQAVAAKGEMDLQRQLEETTTKHDEAYSNFSGPLEERVKVYEDSAKQNYNDIFNSMPEGPARDKFSIAGQSLVNQSVINQTRTADRNRMVLATRTVNEQMNQNAFDLAGIAEQNRSFESKVQDIQTRKGIMEKLTDAQYLAPETRSQLKLALPEQMMKAYVSTAILNNPAEALQAIKSGIFGEVDPLVKKELEGQAQTAMTTFAKKAQVLSTMNDLGTLSDVFGKMAKGERGAAVVTLDAIPDPKVKGKLQQAIYQEDINSPSNPEAEAIINDKVLALEINSKTKTATEDAAALTETMMAITDSYLSNMETKDGISEKKYKQYLSEVLVPYISKIREQKPDTFISAHSGMWQAIQQRFKGFNNLEARTPEAITTFNRALEILKQQPQVTSETITSSMRQALWEQAKQKHPEYAFLVEPPDSVMNANGTMKEITPGGSKAKADVSVKDEAVLMTREGKTMLFPKSQMAALIKNQWKKVNGNS